MKVLFTGGTGFIGQEAVSYLDSLGHEVDNISHAEFDHRDFARLLDMHRDGSQNKPDVVVHAAWPRLQDIHDLCHIEYAQQSMDFFNFCKQEGVRVINLGSHNEYGVKFEPATEDMICEPIDTYGIAKLAVTLYAKKLGFNTLRLFAVYGKGGRNFKSIYETSQKYSHPENTKDFVPVEMVGWAIERLMYAQHLYGEIINVASGKGETAEELARTLCHDGKGALTPKEEVCRECEVMKRFNKYAQRQYEPSEWRGDTKKMERILNLKPPR